MNKPILAIVGLLALGGLIFWGGAVFGQSRWMATDWRPGWMMVQDNFVHPGPGMMNNWNGTSMGPGMMNGNMMGGMMSGNTMHGNMMGGMMSGNTMHGNMMGGMMSGNMMRGNMMGSGMMGNLGGVSNADPLSIEAAEEAIGDYLETLNNDSLGLGEIMIFDNHAYAQILDEETGQGAFEVLVDPITGNVFPEPGPNMMWNTEYGMMAGYGDLMGGSMMGGMMGGYGRVPRSDTEISAEDAVEIAQEFLENNLPGGAADERADSFPGYYTIHVLRDGETVGMLSVNAYTGQVFLHHWHGDFIESTGEAHG